MTRVQIKPCGVAVDGIFTQTRPDDVSHEAWRAAAEAHAARLWDAIGERRVKLARKWINITLHALRTGSRGYGKKRVHWQVTTECGQMMLDKQGWQWWEASLKETTCLSCRTVVRERWEMDLEYGGGADDLLAEYDQQQIEEAWRIQAAWHEPDPVAANWVGEGLSVGTATLAR